MLFEEIYKWSMRRIQMELDTDFKSLSTVRDDSCSRYISAMRMLEPVERSSTAISLINLTYKDVLRDNICQTSKEDMERFLRFREIKAKTPMFPISKTCNENIKVSLLKKECRRVLKEFHNSPLVSYADKDSVLVEHLSSITVLTCFVFHKRNQIEYYNKIISEENGFLNELSTADELNLEWSILKCLGISNQTIYFIRDAEDILPCCNNFMSHSNAFISMLRETGL